MSCSSSVKEIGERETNQAMRYLPLMLLSVLASGQFLAEPADPVDAATLNAMFKAACGGKIANGLCEANPIDGQAGSWNIQAVRFGHFLSPNSEDAIVTTSGFAPLDWFPVGSMLLRKRQGKWEAVGIYRVHLDVRACRKMRLPSGRDSVLCQTHSRSVNSSYSTVLAVEAAYDDLQENEIFIATDSTERCEPYETGDRIVKSVIDKITVGEARPGEHLRIAARYGALDYSPERKRACQDATQKKPGARFPDPPMSPYLVDYVFDGSKFVPAPQSAAAAKLFK
jgi:hypothetical protein